jgi:hypothetical protein
MKTLGKIFLALLLGVTLSYGAAFSKDAKFRSVKVHITAEKPLTTGANVLELRIKKKTKPLNDAKVVVRAFMPAMPGMPAMESKVEAKDLGNGLYEAKLNFAMGGTWQVHIFITPKTGRKSRVKTSINF